MRNFFRSLRVVYFGMAAQAVLNIAIVVLFPGINNLGSSMCLIWFAFSALWLLMAKNPFVRGMLIYSAVMAVAMLFVSYEVTVRGHVSALAIYLGLAVLFGLLASITAPDERVPERAIAVGPNQFNSVAMPGANPSKCSYCGRIRRKNVTEYDEFEYHCPGCGRSSPA